MLKVIKKEYCTHWSSKYIWLIIYSLLASLYFLFIPLTSNENILNVVQAINLYNNSFISVLIPCGLDSIENTPVFIKNILFLLYGVSGLYSLNLGIHSVSKDINSGIMRFYYSNCISRDEIYFAKLLSSLINIISLNIILFLITCSSYSYFFKLNYMELVIKNINFVVCSIILSGCVYLIGQFVSILIKNNRICQTLGIIGSIIYIYFDLVIRVKISGHNTNLPLFKISKISNSSIILTLSIIIISIILALVNSRLFKKINMI